MISAYLDEELSEQETKKLLAHLEQCPHCNEELTILTVQRECMASLAVSDKPPMAPSDFARTVMSGIDQVSVQQVGLLRRIYESLVEEMLLPIRKPAVALPLVLLLVTGTVTGYYLQTLPNKSQQKMLSVYELTAARSTPDPEGTPVAEAVDLHLFDHFADTSAETFAEKPCLLEYTSYTCSTDVQDY